MATTRNANVAINFLNGNSARSLNMEATLDGRLFSYNTIIAQIIIKDGQRILLLNKNKYSVTTSAKHQSPLFRAVEQGYKYHFDKVIEIYDRVPYNTRNLEGYIK